MKLKEKWYWVVCTPLTPLGIFRTKQDAISSIMLSEPGGGLVLNEDDNTVQIIGSSAILYTVQKVRLATEPGRLF